MSTAFVLLIFFGALAYAAYALRKPIAAPRVPAAPSGDLTTRVTDVLREVPLGKVITFAALAARAGASGDAMLVGKVVRALAGREEVPWWRAVRRYAGVGLVPPTAEGERQRRMLDAEGVVCGEKGIHLARYEWRP